MVTPSRGTTARVTIALSGDALYAVRAGGAPVRLRLDPQASDSHEWASLGQALATLADQAGLGANDQAELSVILLPPLAEARTLELLPMRAHEIEHVLARNPGRYFVSAHNHGGYLVSAVRPRLGSGAGGLRVLAAAASARVIRSIHAAAAGAGWTIRTMVPVETAWAQAAVRLWPAFKRAESSLLVTQQDRTDLLRIDGGRLVAVRRFRPADADADAIAESLGAGAAGATAAVGDAEQRRLLTRALAERRITLASVPSDWASVAADPQALAASVELPENGLHFHTAEDHVREAADTRRAAWSLIAAAAVLLVGGAAFQWVGLHRHLRAVRDERTALRPQLATTMVGRTSVDAATRQLATLTAADRLAPRWSTIIAAISDRLPDDASLTAFHARGDSLIIDGLADHAARVFDNLVPLPGVSGLKAAAPVRREIQDDGTAREHFTISARALP